jgi:hypothetical protein
MPRTESAPGGQVNEGAREESRQPLTYCVVRLFVITEVKFMEHKFGHLKVHSVLAFSIHNVMQPLSPSSSKMSSLPQRRPRAHYQLLPIP